MSTSSTHMEDKSYRDEWQDDFRLFKRRAYVAGMGRSLSDVNLERGDTLPDDSAYEIIDARFDTTKSGGRVAVVIGMKEVTV